MGSEEQELPCFGEFETCSSSVFPQVGTSAHRDGSHPDVDPVETLGSTILNTQGQLALHWATSPTASETVNKLTLGHGGRNLAVSCIATWLKEGRRRLLHLLHLLIGLIQLKGLIRQTLHLMLWHGRSIVGHESRRIKLVRCWRLLGRHLHRSPLASRRRSIGHLL